MKYKIFLLLIVILTSCNKPNSDKVQIETIKVGEDKEALVDSKTYFKSSKLIALQTIELSIFSRIDKIILHEDKLFILDKKLKSVFVFDSNGFFLYKIQSVGKGPHEYLSLMDFTIDEKNKHIILYTDRPYSLFIYNIGGKYIKMLKMNDLYYNMSSYNDKVVFLNKEAEKKYSFLEYDLVSQKEEGYLEINDIDNIYKNYGIGRSSITKDKTIHLNFPYSQTIYEYNENGLRAKYYIDFGKRNIPNNIYEEKKNLNELFTYAEKNNYNYAISDFRENKDFITFKYDTSKLLIYSKKNKEAKKVEVIKNEDMVYGSYIAHDGNDNKLITAMSAIAFKKQITIYKNIKDQWDLVPKKVKELDAKISENDNPLLLIYTFK